MIAENKSPWRTVNKGAAGFDKNVVEMVKYGHENES